MNEDHLKSPLSVWGQRGKKAPITEKEKTAPKGKVGAVHHWKRKRERVFTKGNRNIKEQKNRGCWGGSKYGRRDVAQKQGTCQFHCR